MQRRAIIGVFGGDQQSVAGKEFGALVARAGYILLTGGNGKDDKEIKNATMIGATEAAGSSPSVVARLIGILPNQEECLLPPAPRTSRLLLRTQMTSEERNVINGMTPDVVVIFGGGLGTVAEAAFAKAAGKELIFYNGLDQRKKRGVDRLRGHLPEFDREENIQKYLRTPLSKYPNNVLPIDQSTEGLKQLLEKTLDAANGPTDIPTLVTEVNKLVTKNIRKYLRTPLSRYSNKVLPIDQSTEGLKQLLRETLDAAATETEIPKLVTEVKKLVTKVANVPDGQADNVMLVTSTGFPGLPELCASKARFEEIVVRISSSSHPELFCTTLAPDR
ncbi:hypothetical protein PMN64_00245 [Bradyrhizobium sp. UFLA01-814]|uniref:SLOG cluster 4 domain-containing protein n=1 Tax=Bradyrhizobium sp. UFLA01-814 TaxID=3023480 RepID=UPI00398A738B